MRVKLRNETKITSRQTHSLVALVFLLALIAALYFLSDLRNGVVNTFATIGGFLTAYGVAFAIVEVVRTRSAADIAAEASRSARKEVTALYGVKDIVQCQIFISAAIEDIENSGWASMTTLSRIIERYASEFHSDYQNPTSEHRLLVTALQSHAASAAGPPKPATLKRLRATLLKMQGNIAAAAGGKISEPTK